MSSRCSLLLFALLLAACDRSPRQPVALAGEDAATYGNAAPAAAGARWGSPARAAVTSPADKQLRVCADPNNLPFSNEQGEGFENALAQLVARELGREVTYTWWPQRRGFARNTLKAGMCDVIVGVPAAYEQAWATRPYYRSTYVFVTRRDRHLTIRSLDDPQLKHLQIGVHLIGDDYSNTPGAAALARRGITRNVRGYSIYGDYSNANPPTALILAVERGEIDVAIAWGPLAGWMARTSRTPLALTPVQPQVDPPFTPFVFDIAMATRRDDPALHAALDDIIVRRATEIDALLARWGVPRVTRATGGA